MWFFQKNKKPDFSQLYNTFKNKFKDKISDERKAELLKIMQNNGYYPSSFANLDLSDNEAIFCLDNKKNCNTKFNQTIKIINLNALTGIMDWIKQLVILPPGTIIYLMPFQERDFEFAYFIKSFDVDKSIGSKEYVQTFIYMAHKAGHRVIYDFLMQFSRYAEPVIENPFLVRWIDVKDTEDKISQLVNNTGLEKEYGEEDINIIKNIYYQESKGNLSEEYKKLYEIFENKILEGKKELSKKIYSHKNQIKLRKKVQGCSVKSLIEQGLWTIPCGTDNEFGLPIFDYMNTNENYPVFKHFDKNGNDISENIKDDFQTPAYYKDIETNTINKDVLNFMLKIAKQYINDYNFDGFRIKYTENIFNENYNDKIPVEFLKIFNKKIKDEYKNFILITNGKYDYFKQYQDLGFDIVWNNLENLTPQEILLKQEKLANYNTEDLNSKNLSAIKIYNDRFCELSNTNPVYLGEKGALFKWFCLNFLPAGKNAKFSILYLDGDESFTYGGFAKTIFENAKLERNTNETFYKKFNAIHNFAVNSEIIKDGEATIIEEDCDGFSSWIISKEPLKELFLIVANYNNTNAIINKMINLPGECKIYKEYILNDGKFDEKPISNTSDLLEIEILEPNDFRIFLLRK
jgi:hypothetical protein